jgi:hypothetical protein
MNVCRRCRLVQEEAGSCTACGAPRTQPTAQLRPRRALTLVPREPPTGARGAAEMLATGLVMCLGWMAGGLLDSALVAFALFLLAFAAGVGTRYRLPRLVAKLSSRRLLPPPPNPPYIGTAEPIDETLPATFRDVRAVAILLAVGHDPFHPLFWRVSSVDFWLVPNEGERMLVTGNVTVHPPATIDSCYRGAASAFDLERLGVPAEIPLRGELNWEIVVPIGAHVEVSGWPQRELIAGVGYRDQEVLVLRGRPGTPLGLRILEAA